MENQIKISELEKHEHDLAELRRRVRGILELDPVSRLREIIDSPNAIAIVRAFPPQELLITIKQVGEADALPLIELAGLDQLRFFSDVEWWVGDALDTDRIMQWMYYLAECGDQKIIEWLKSVDSDFFVTVLRKFMVVTKPDEDMPPDKLSGAEPPVTIDGLYHLNFFTEEASRIFSRVLRIFAAKRFDLYTRMMEAIVWETGTETEELAIRWRNGRLRDLGIPDLDEAMEIYRYLDAKTFLRLPKKETSSYAEMNFIPPKYPLMSPGGERLLLLDAMKRLTNDAAIDGIAQELAHLVNRVLVADHEDLSSVEAMMRAAKRVRAAVSMGLEVLAGADIGRAAEIISSNWLLNVFQVGNGMGLGLARRAHKMLRAAWLNIAGAEELLDEPLRQIFNGLKRPRPMWFTGEAADPYRPFLRSEEIIEASKALDAIEYLGELFFNRLKLLKPDVKSWSHKRVYPADVTFGSVFRTAFANAASGRGFSYKALRKEDLQTIIENAFEELKGDDKTRRLSKDAKKNLFDYLDLQNTALNDKERKIRDAFVLSCVDVIETELGGLDSNSGIDQRFVHGMLIRR